MKLKKANLALISLLLVSFFIRIYKIDTLSLFGDEVDVGYQAFSIFKTGHDYKGNFLPVYIQSLSESRAPLLIYTSIPGIKIFGLTELGVRITPIIFGILNIYLLYKLVLLLSKSSKLAFFSAFALSFSPWHFHYSRTAFEVTLLISLILAAIYFAYRFTDQNKNKYLYLSIILFSLSFYTYNTANIFVPLIVLSIFFSNFKTFSSKIKFKNFFISLILFLILVSPLIYQIFFGAAAGRFKLINIFHDQTLIEQIINKRTSLSSVSPTTEAIFHNKPTAWANEFIKNYLTAFSFPFLFVSGDQINIRHTIPGFGLIFVSFLPFLVLGLFSLNLKEKLNRLMLFWLLFSPIASSLTTNGETHATRLFLMIIPIAYFSALGLVKLASYKNIFTKIFIFIISLFFIFQISAYTHEYFVHYPKDFFKDWNYGYKDIFKSIPYPSDKTLIISDTNFNSLLSFLFYHQINPTEISINDTEKKNILKDFDGFQISPNIFFINNWHTSDLVQKLKDTAEPNEEYFLFQLNDIPGDMDFSQEALEGFTSIKTIYNPNQTILGQIIQKS